MKSKCRALLLIPIVFILGYGCSDPAGPRVPESEKDPKTPAPKPTFDESSTVFGFYA